MIKANDKKRQKMIDEEETLAKFKQGFDEMKSLNNHKPGKDYVITSIENEKSIVREHFGATDEEQQEITLKHK